MLHTATYPTVHSHTRSPRPHATVCDVWLRAKQAQAQRAQEKLELEEAQSARLREMLELETRHTRDSAELVVTQLHAEHSLLESSSLQQQASLLALRRSPPFIRLPLFSLCARSPSLSSLHALGPLALSLVLSHKGAHSLPNFCLTDVGTLTQAGYQCVFLSCLHAHNSTLASITGHIIAFTVYIYIYMLWPEQGAGSVGRGAQGQ